MVTRRHLTPDLVDDEMPPSIGELWIADTLLKGFGLRLWSSRSGGRKAFAIRVTDIDGHNVRRTFNLSSSWRYRWNQHRGEDEYHLGDYLEEARSWARDEIDTLKRRLTIHDEKQIQWERASARIKKITFGRAADSVIAGMRANGLSEAYVDRLAKLFGNMIPEEIKRRRLTQIKAKVIANILVDRRFSPGNIRTLRAFIGQIFKRASALHGPVSKFLDDLPKEFSKAWDKKYDVAFPDLRSLNEHDYQKMFDELERNDDKWQQALCVRLFFEFGTPLTRLMAAKWRQIISDGWYPYRPDERVYWFSSRENVTPKASELLEKIRVHVSRQFGESEYLFPSRHAGNTRHITTVDSLWRATLHKSGYSVLSAP